MGPQNLDYPDRTARKSAVVHSSLRSPRKPRATNSTSPESLPRSETPLQIKGSNATIKPLAKISVPERHALVKFGEYQVSQVPTKLFTDPNGILPPLKKGINIERVIERLGQEVSAHDEHRSDLAGDPHQHSDITNDSEGVGDIEYFPEVIREASGISDAPTLVFRYNSGVSSDSSTSVKPDAYGVLTRTHARPEGSRRVRWIDVAVPVELTKISSNGRDADVSFDRPGCEGRDNYSLAFKLPTKIIPWMTSIMQEDARRRFVIAFTVEDMFMRLWLATRSEILASYPFDWLEVCRFFCPWFLATDETYQDYSPTVEIFLRLMYADEIALGWDPTMERLSPRDHIGDVQYLIECSKVKYRTVRLIADVGAEAICSRGTRVWEVREVKKNGKEDPTPLALKDSWVDADREREGKILETIREEAEHLPDVFDFDKFFMRAKEYSDVYIGGVQDNTHRLIHGRHSVDGMLDKPPSIKAGLPKSSEPRNSVGTEGASQVNNVDRPQLVEHSAKIHHRIVFAEVGTTIAEVDSLAAATLAMVGIVQGKHRLDFPTASSHLMFISSFVDSPQMRMGTWRHQYRQYSGGGRDR